MQKVYIVNTFLFSKLWYTSQAVKLDEKAVKVMLSRAKTFIHAGENEKPIEIVNFRDISKGGLGLINPILKSKALMIKGMYKEFVKNGSNAGNIDKLYGYPKIFKELNDDKITSEPVKVIYQRLLHRMMFRNGSLIPSRNERRTNGIKWSLTWKNWKNLRGVNAEEKMLVWKIFQDTLPIGRRIRRKNAEKRCLRTLQDGTECQIIPDLLHVLSKCQVVEQSF